MYYTTLHRRPLVQQAFKFADVLIMMGAFGLASIWVAAAREPAALSWDQLLLTGDQLFDEKITVSNVLLFLGLLLLWHQILTSFRLYQSHRFAAHSAEMLDVVKAASLGSLTIVAAGSLFSVNLIVGGPIFIIVFWVTSVGGTILFRLCLRSGLRWARLRGHNLRNVLIIGTNVRAREFARMIRSNPELGYKLVGFVDEEWEGIDNFHRSGEKLVASFDDLAEFLRNRAVDKDQVVDEVVIALPVRSSYEHTSRIVAQCEEQGIIVRFYWDLFNLTLARSKVEMFQDRPVITLSSGAMEGWPVQAKRLLDIAVSAILLVALVPFFLIIGLAVKLTSPGPVFFIQPRVGLNKRIFHLFKFRTMVVNAEEIQKEIEHLNEASGPVFKIENDPRLTPIGNFLRKYSIDELPQLINVLLGDMSLVGPRPLPVRDYRRFDQDSHRRRFCVRPGLTCLWQIRGRNSVPFERWMEFDMFYIDNWTFWMDLKILAQTIPVVVSGSGAVKPR